VICPKCGAARLIIHCSEQAAVALAEGQHEWADGWAELAARIQGDDAFDDPGESGTGATNPRRGAT
jgi:hypothetical protein